LYLGIFFLLGVILTAIGTYAIAAILGGTLTYFFHDYFSPTMILAAVMLFLFLNTVQTPSQTEAETPRSKVYWLLRTISENRLAIYMLQVMVLESLQLGFFGFTLSSYTLNSIIEVPLISVITLFICLAIIMLLKKIPVMKRLIG